MFSAHVVDFFHRCTKDLVTNVTLLHFIGMFLELTIVGKLGLAPSAVEVRGTLVLRQLCRRTKFLIALVAALHTIHMDFIESRFEEYLLA